MPVDVRFIAATNREIDAAVADGTFRRDLYFRLSATRLSVQPLVRRRADIIPILAGALGLPDHRAFTTEALESLLTYDWPCNVRELLDVAHTLPTDAGQVDYQALPASMTRFLKRRIESESVARRRFKAPERSLLVRELAAADGNVTELARRLGKHRNQVVRWLNGYGIQTGG